MLYLNQITYKPICVDPCLSVVNRNMTNFLKELDTYVPTKEEQCHYEKIVHLVEAEPRCFWRDCFPAHITGSSLLINKEGNQVLLNHHKFLNKWLGFGGHADGSTDILEVARRETKEESSISEFTLAIEGIFNVSTHPIPANSNKEEPPHEHFNIDYLFQCTHSNAFQISDESVTLRWCNFDQAITLVKSHESMTRMLHKWGKWQEKHT